MKHYVLFVLFSTIFGVFQQCEVTQNMVFVEGSSFIMGCTSEQDSIMSCHDDEKPAHEVSVSDFYISKYEVTNGEYAEFLNAKGNHDEAYKNWIKVDSKHCQIKKQDKLFVVESSFEKYPVVEVTWYGAKAYAKWKNMRLPTEAEWEYAARGGIDMQITQYAGSDNIDEVASYWGAKSVRTHIVGAKKSNKLGIFDMTGNVWEWCEDWYDRDYYKNSSQNNPINKIENTTRVLRGGSWFDSPTHCRVTNRFYGPPLTNINNAGFRLASDL